MTHSTRWILAAVTLAAIVSSLVACSSTDATLQTDEPPHVWVGTSKADAVARLGQPDESKTIVKQQEHIWGPAEDFWYTLDMGDSIEIWTYKSPQGTLQLYFLRGSETVDYEAFVDKDIVY